jgi:hypothetical protein
MTPEAERLHRLAGLIGSAETSPVRLLLGREFGTESLASPSTRSTMWARSTAKPPNHLVWHA